HVDAASVLPVTRCKASQTQVRESSRVNLSTVIAINASAKSAVGTHPGTYRSWPKRWSAMFCVEKLSRPLNSGIHLRESASPIGCETREPQPGINQGDGRLTVKDRETSIRVWRPAQVSPPRMQGAGVPATFDHKSEHLILASFQHRARSAQTSG